MDVILALPQIISALIVISMFGASTMLIVLTVGISTVPRIARVVRGAAVSVVERDFVAAAESLGESRVPNPAVRAAAQRRPGHCSSKPTCA